MVKTSQAAIAPARSTGPTAAPRPNRANPRQRAQRAATRARLVEGAQRVFARLGYANATIEHVLAEAQVSRAACYAHFSGKAELVAALAEHFAPVWQPLYAELAAMPDHTPEALHEWCARHVRLYREHQDTCIILTQAAAIEQDLYWQMARYQEAIIDLLGHARPQLAHLLDDAQARIRAALALSQIDHACYFLAVRHWRDDPSAGIAAMADNLGRFLRENASAGAPTVCPSI